jgi:hypothetical protein
VSLVGWNVIVTLWHILVALWETRGLIAAAGFAL